MEETSNVELDACLFDVLTVFLFDLLCGSVCFAVKLLHLHCAWLIWEAKLE